MRESPTQNFDGEAAILDSSTSMSVLTCTIAEVVHQSTSAAREGGQTNRAGLLRAGARHNLN